MGASETGARSQAVVEFAEVLAELRASVGRPSFRTMAGRSRAISHTTLHEAVQGNRLPSWPTTAEFVKACGAEPQDYRERWEAAFRAVGQAQTAGGPAGTPAAGAVPEIRPDDPDPDPDRGDGAGAGATGDGSPGERPVPVARTRRRLLVAALLVPTAVAGAIGGAAWSPMRHDGSAPPNSSSPTYGPGDCPVRQTNPPSAPPEHEGDQVTFVRDVTLDDCTHVPRRQTVRKAWQLRNSGTVEWRGYSLHRIDPQGRDDCQTITDIPVPTTAPGHVVEVAVDVTTPNEPGFCFVRFKMVDGAGKVAYPGGRPLNFQLIVDP